MTDWIPLDTTTHQDHVIAHLIDATVLGYFTLDETLHVLLDIGFVWKIYLDGEMVLLPQSLAIREVEVDEETRSDIQAACDDLSNGNLEREYKLVVPAKTECAIADVALFSRSDGRRLVIKGEKGTLLVETSLVSGEIKVAES